MPATPPPRITRAGWGDAVLSAQRALLSLHTDASFSTAERPVTLPSGRVVNVVVATPARPAARSVLCLLHGWGSGLAFFSRALPHLVSAFRAVYLVDVPGMGASSRGRFRRAGVHETLDYFIADLDQMAAALADSDPVFRHADFRILAAHSMGAYISVEWLLRAPRFDKLILISPVGVPARPDKPDRMSASALQRTLYATLSALWRAGVTPQSMLRLLPTPLARRFCRDYIAARYMGDYTPEEFDLMVEYCTRVSTAPSAGERAATTLLLPGAWAVVPLMGRLPKLNVPVTFVYGEQDWMDWRAGETARGVMSVPSRLERVPDADHNVFVDNAPGFADVVLRAVADFENGVF